MRQSLIARNRELIRQGLAMLDGMTAAAYARREERTGAAGIGEHVRHCADFYECFLRGAPGGRVDYDERARDPRLERDPARARECLARIGEQLAALDAARLPDAVTVRMDSADADGRTAWAPSTPERELQFLASHTVHHYAIIALQLRLAGQDPPGELGVAPATLRHWETSSDRAR
jgi:uncharacterized damage-inducible protein DinB